MNSATLLGLLILLVAGVTNGSFTLPMKFTRRWKWENTWLVYSVWALFVLPPLVTWLTVPNLGATYHSASNTVIAVVAACGFGWGVSQIFFGLAVEGVGIALAFSVILGLSAAVGSLVPFLRDTPGELFQRPGLVLLLGLALVLAGVAVCGVAGSRRERARKPAGGVSAAAGGTATVTSPVHTVSVARGLLYCAISGVGSALVGIGLYSGSSLQALAQQNGAASYWAPNAAWLPLMVAGGVPGVAYCAYLVRKNRTGVLFQEPGTSAYYGLAFIMAIFWFGSTLLYGISAGKLGTVVAWPVFMSLIVIMANALGLVTGEWKGAGRKALEAMGGGVAILIAAILVLAHVS